MLGYVEPYKTEDDFHLELWDWTPAANLTLAGNMALAGKDVRDELVKSHMHFSTWRTDEAYTLTVGLAGNGDGDPIWQHFDIVKVFSEAAKDIQDDPSAEREGNLDYLEAALEACLQEVREIRATRTPHKEEHEG